MFDLRCHSIGFAVAHLNTATKSVENGTFYCTFPLDLSNFYVTGHLCFAEAHVNRLGLGELVKAEVAQTDTAAAVFDTSPG